MYVNIAKSIFTDSLWVMNRTYLLAHLAVNAFTLINDREKEMRVKEYRLLRKEVCVCWRSSI